jgi:hypothetical protein
MTYRLPRRRTLENGKFAVHGIGIEKFEDNGSLGEVDVTHPLRVIGIFPHGSEDQCTWRIA